MIKPDDAFVLLCQSIIAATLDFLKYNFAVSLVAGVIFFLIILVIML
jgi:hypothetical protein